MKNKKIVIISKMFFPENAPRAQRTTELAKELAKRNFNVIVYAPLQKFNVLEYEKEHSLTLKNISSLKYLNKLTKSKPKVLRGLDYLLKKTIEYPDIELFFKPLEILKKEKNVHTVISIGMPHTLHWGTAWAKKKLKNKFPQKWIADCGDPFMGNPINKPFFYFKYLEKFFCKNADFITIPILEAKEAYYPAYHSKIKIIPQGFNLSDIIVKNNTPQNNIPTFCYAGSIYLKHRNPSVFLDYLAGLTIDFKFIVYTNATAFFQKYKHKLGDKLVIRKYIPRLELLDILQDMDFVVNFENNTTLQTPSKLIDYTLINVPILSINCVNFNDSHFKEFIKKNYTNRLIVKNVSQYDIKNVGDKFVNLIEK
ncbi:hypothetical protein [Polaribacter aestuariivivens]|uniref:hypothetical protein n=1 Tax=Polaribacter aestuariivivens TaxID=2304626 RepID=UPI003F49200E